MAEDPLGDEEAEVAAIFARLRAEVRRPSTETEAERGSPGRARELRARADAERLWPAITAVPTRRPGLKGALGRPVKAVVYRLVRWYVEPFAAQQRDFNRTTLDLIDELTDRLGKLEQPDVPRTPSGPDPRSGGS